jgi:PAS domain-containing protein
VNLRVSPLSGQDGSAHWLVSVTDMAAVSSSAVNGLRPSSLLARAPIGIIVRDLELRCTWVNDIAELRDGIPGEDPRVRALCDGRADPRAERCWA